jgi:hypothetical protein
MVLMSKGGCSWSSLLTLLKYCCFQVRAITADLQSANLQYIKDTLQSSSMLETQVTTVFLIQFHLFQGKCCAISHLYDSGFCQCPQRSSWS